jgi:hypothetical protein
MNNIINRKKINRPYYNINKSPPEITKLIIHKYHGISFKTLLLHDINYIYVPCNKNDIKFIYNTNYYTNLE